MTAARRDAAPRLANVKPELLPTMLKAGVPPAMHFGENVTYWGEKYSWVQRAALSQIEEEALGLRDSKPRDSEARE